MRNTNEKQKNHIKSIMEQGEILEEPIRITNALNNHFGIVGLKTVQGIAKSYREFREIQCGQMIFLYPCTMEELMTVINSLKQRFLTWGSPS